MERKEFLNLLGLSAATVLFMDALSGCQKTDFAPQNVDFTIDLSDAKYASLANNGGFVYISGVILTRTSSGNLIALSQACTHQGCTVAYESGQNNFYCGCHGSIFSENGQVIRGPASKPLTMYNTDQAGSMLHVYSA